MDPDGFSSSRPALKKIAVKNRAPKGPIFCYNQNMIKAIAFDFGGVIEIKDGNLFQEIAEYLQISLEDWERVYSSLNHMHNTGEKKGDEVVALTAKEFNASDEQISYINDLILKIRKTKKINYELLEIIRKLKERNYKVGLLSNNSVNLNKKLQDENITGIFDVIVISGDVGFQKPQPEIFKILSDRLGVKLNELIFIDDTEKSLEGAENIGYTPILFINNQKLGEELVGIL